MWIIWNCRNQKVFRNEDINLVSLEFKFWNVHNGIVGSSSEHLQVYKTILCKWEPPNHPFYCLNIDGSVQLEDHTAGIGCIIRNSSGNLILAGAAYLGRTDINMAELIALRTGILMALRANITSLVIQSDSKYVVSCVRREREQHIGYSYICSKTSLNCTRRWKRSKSLLCTGNKMVQLINLQNLLVPRTFGLIIIVLC